MTCLTKKGKYLIAKPRPEPEKAKEPVLVKARVREVRIFGLKVKTSIEYISELEVK